MLPKDLFKLRCVANNCISDSFRIDFSKLTSRLESLDSKYEISNIIQNKPDILVEANKIYLQNNKSLKALTTYIEDVCNDTSASNSDISNKDDLIKKLQNEVTLLRQENDKLVQKNNINPFKTILNNLISFFKKIFQRLFNKK